MSSGGIHVSDVVVALKRTRSVLVLLAAHNYALAAALTTQMHWYTVPFLVVVATALALVASFVVDQLMERTAE